MNSGSAPRPRSEPGSPRRSAGTRRPGPALELNGLVAAGSSPALLGEDVAEGVLRARVGLLLGPVGRLPRLTLEVVAAPLGLRFLKAAPSAQPGLEARDRAALERLGDVIGR